MPKAERRASDWYCIKCRRKLSNFGPSRRDTVTPQIKGKVTSWRHDNCGGGQVVAGG